MTLSDLPDTDTLPRSGFSSGEIDPRSTAHILDYMLRFSRRYGKELVLYGGQTATPLLFGCHSMRSCTNDLDYYCSEEGIHRVIQNERELRYHPDYDIIFMYLDTIPVTFSCGHIHDLAPAHDFFATAVSLPVPGGYIFCCSREYSIMLKLRRAKDCREQHRKIFGKDAIDIISMLTASRLRSDRPALNIPLLVSLIRQSVSPNPAELAAILRRVYEYVHHLSKHEIPVFESVFADVLREIVRQEEVL